MPNLPPGSSTLVLTAGPTPADGNPFVLQVPPKVRWRLLSISCRFQPDANVADRYMSIFILRASQMVYTRRSNIAIPASTDTWVTFGPGDGAETGAAGHSITCPFSPLIYLQEDDAVQLSAYNIQLTDLLFQPTIMTEQWLEL